MTPNPTDQDVAALVARLAKAIEGPHKALPAGMKYTLTELRDLRWAGLSANERAMRRCEAKSVLAEFATALLASEARATALEAERDEARGLVIEANNSLFGSQAYFHSTDGGPYNKYHLARAIEDLKNAARISEAQLARAREVLEPFALISSEGVVTAETGHVAVTTCAEYFHRAAEALRSPAPADGRGEARDLSPVERTMLEIVQRDPAYFVLLTEAEGEAFIANAQAFLTSRGIAFSTPLAPDGRGEDDGVASARLARQEWQTIETAPRDGTKIDIWAHWPEFDRYERTADAYWNGSSWQLGQYSQLRFMQPPTITHWMPTPAPPEGTGRNLADANQKITQTGDRDDG